jgi:hypothetical protein
MITLLFPLKLPLPFSLLFSLPLRGLSAMSWVAS